MSYYINKLNQKIAYKRISGKSPGIIFVHGLNSDMEGKKAINIEKYAKKNKIAFIRFDCRGHGKSHGNFEDFTISDWKNDLINILDKLTKGPQILIGSSMGGWLMILAAMARPKSVSGLIGLAAATDFGSSLFNQLSKRNKNEVRVKGYTHYNNQGYSSILSKNFFVDANKNNILNKKFKFNKPIFLIHGMKDDVVSPEMPKKIMQISNSKNIQIKYLKNSDHRLSLENDLITINHTIDEIRNLI